MSGKIVQDRCSECGEQKRLAYHHLSDEAKDRVCATCYRLLTYQVDACTECGKLKRLAYHHPIDDAKGRVCQNCYRRLTDPPHAAPGHVEDPADGARKST